MYRKVYEVTGFVPADGGFILCPVCHQNYQHVEDGCDCAAVFLGTETDYAQSCDDCGGEIETTVLA